MNIIFKLALIVTVALISAACGSSSSSDGIEVTFNMSVTDTSGNAISSVNTGDIFRVSLGQSTSKTPRSVSLLVALSTGTERSSWDTMFLASYGELNSSYTQDSLPTECYCLYSDPISDDGQRDIACADSLEKAQSGNFQSNAAYNFTHPGAGTFYVTGYACADGENGESGCSADQYASLTLN